MKMKHLKLFENIKSISSIIDISNKYHEILKFVKPIVIKRNNEIAEDYDLSQDIVDVYGGNNHYVIRSINYARVVEVKMHDNKIFFTLEHFDPYGEEKQEFYIPFTKEELEQGMMELDADKYNL